ncbi:carbamoyl phosphate synthase small subunit [Brucepastera parasyntrophica]|uniref:carbamoyl phosphate synthase small subunit n=1 Tax=Brucepastera parasyntrophica TaxID=2880008 RepID=UPI00210E113C|nr:carbamoyl phosphate synthase small subunit [Brucepastera parasyntrophica]ULQ58779.1 carbamoyl phosphate synthase small subunit [Brucepastera parasyntrophica]
MVYIEPTARIILEDGTEYEGTAFGHTNSAAGEIVFYTGTADIPRLLSDPALRGMILVLSTPGVGAAGIPQNNIDESGLETLFESARVQAAGLVLPYYSAETEHITAYKTLDKWMKKYQIPGISDVDTRALVQRLREKGTMRAKILVSNTREVSFASIPFGAELPSHQQIIHYGSGEKKLILVDCGVRSSAVRSLLSPGITVRRVPWNYDYTGEEFDGIFISGGNSDPSFYRETSSILKNALTFEKPVFATGHGAAILAAAAGALPFHMARGHRSSSVPCIDLETGRCHITAQNHGYGIYEDSLPPGWETLFLNNMDNSIEGFTGKKGLFCGVLFNPEGNPGPRDTVFLYNRFLDLVRNGGLSS